MSGLKLSLKFAALSALVAISCVGNVRAHESDELVPLAGSNTNRANPGKKLLKFDFNQRPEDTYLYDLARKSMAKMFAGTDYDEKRPSPVNPSLMLNQTDLNGDDIPEILALPIESTEEANTFCKWWSVCPYYVIRQSGKSLHTLGVIYAEELALGDSVVDGYWTIKAYTKESETSKPYGSYFETYVYDKSKDEYVKKPAAGAAPKP